MESKSSLFDDKRVFVTIKKRTEIAEIFSIPKLQPETALYLNIGFLLGFSSKKKQAVKIEKILKLRKLYIRH